MCLKPCQALWIKDKFELNVGALFLAYLSIKSDEFHDCAPHPLIGIGTLHSFQVTNSGLWLRDGGVQMSGSEVRVNLLLSQSEVTSSALFSQSETSIEGDEETPLAPYQPQHPSWASSIFLDLRIFGHDRVSNTLGQMIQEFLAKHDGDGVRRGDIQLSY